MHRSFKARVPCVVCVSAFFLVTATTLAADSPGPVRVQVVKRAGQWQLLRDGKPYFIKGAGDVAPPAGPHTAGTSRRCG